MIRFIASIDSPSGLIKNAVPKWFERHETVDGHSEAAQPQITSSPETGVEYYRADWRFNYEEDKVELTGGLQNAMSNASPWYQIAYHVCDHDEETRHGCEWGSVDQSGDIPEHVPSVQIPDTTEEHA